MQFWKIRRHWAFKVGVSSTILLIGLIVFWPKHTVISFDEARRLAPTKPGGLFKSYSSSELKKKKLKNVDFQFDASENRNFAVDPRLEVGFKDRIVSHDFLPSGELIEWDYTSQIISKNADNLIIERRGHGRIHRQEWVEFKIRYECLPQIERLSSGVIQKTLSCAALDDVDPWREMRVAYSSCRVEPLSPRSRRAKAQYGQFKIKSGTNFARATRETVTIDGDIFCDGKHMGLGRETLVTIYTNEQPSLQNPAVGTRKELFLIRTVTAQSGRVLAFSRDELMGSDRPNRPANPSRFNKRIARK